MKKPSKAYLDWLNKVTTHALAHPEDVILDYEKILKGFLMMVATAASLTTRKEVPAIAVILDHDGKTRSISNVDDSQSVKILEGLIVDLKALSAAPSTSTPQ
jgi:hypothetical protein